MNYTSLLLEQTPPLSVPLRFILTAPLFVVLACLLLLLGDGDVLQSRWTPTLLAATHLFTLGFMAMVMFGAMMQLLPVLLGLPLASAQPLSRWIHALLVVGVLCLSGGMAWSLSWLTLSGAIACTLAIVVFCAACFRVLLRSPSTHATATAMKLAIISLLITLVVALLVLWSSEFRLPTLSPLTDLHLLWGLMGWCFILLVGVAYQVVPMFQLTPEYPAWLRKGLAWSAFIVLALASGWYLYSGGMELFWLLVMSAAGFAGITLQLQSRRRRKLADVTLDYWRLAMFSLITSALLLAAGAVFDREGLYIAAGCLFIIGFAVSAISGMLYKIVPFLVWLHLNRDYQTMGYLAQRAPNMRQIIREKYARWQLRLHTAGLLVLPVGVWSEPFTQIGALILLISFVLLTYNLWEGGRCYRDALQTARTSMEVRAAAPLNP